MATIQTHLSILEAKAASHGSLPLLKIPNGDLPDNGWRDVTFAQFLNDVETYARYWVQEFSKAGWEKQSIIGIWLKGTSYLDLVNIWAVSRAGYIPQLISIRMPNPDVVFEMLKQAGAAALIVDPSFEPLLTETTLPILFSASLTSSSGDGLPKLPQLDTPPDPNDTLMIFHTSGSTSGNPKLVPVTARWLDFAIEKMSHSKLLSSSGKQQVVVSGGSFCHMASNLLMWGYIYRSGCIIVPTELPYSSSELKQMVSQCGLTKLNMFSGFLSKMLAEARHDESVLAMLKDFEYVVYSGLVLNEEDRAWAQNQGLKLVNVFASTEVGVMLQSDEPSGNILKPAPGTIYEFIPLPDTLSLEKPLLELVVFPESKDCPPTQLRSPVTGKFHTGDLFTEEDPGLYTFQGRNDAWIKMENAMRCNTAEIEENAMQTCGADLIDVAAVVGAGRPSPVLIVEPKEGKAISGSESSINSLRSEILQRILPFQSRRYIHERVDNISLVLIAPRGSLPRTATKGNIRRAVVEQQYQTEMDSIFLLPN
ncbi:acetyl-CoA synthetase-like protein [Pochonia chlamydosporia 170]|uniref:Acetyl-CoA synthetase-like protein n=1 Tax=Pochonia chlamydosporia 170 TaxID=1380566 RepID=A0A179FID3_METCM|nr:acetyl-CoA synthetase-like protein [Pochonia chlamydosporia 170]OAQ65038.1 acetyl-CoA synthetase-like protein [Pochonia chlamydosporia 170]